MPGSAFPRVRWLSMLEEALARSPLPSLSITRSYASLSKIGSPSWVMPSRYVQRIKSPTNIQNAYWSLQHWKEIMPEALESGRVRIQGSSFFASSWDWKKLMFWVLKKVTTSLHHNLLGKRTSPSSCSPK